MFHVEKKLSRLRGHCLITAATNEEMIKIHKKERVDLIVAQLDMPGIKSEKLFNVILSNIINTLF